ncbi:DUF58 domain-containing protein [Zavarzinella formosa]|uniref:DUF58 domain-containing protein n=1 Tax=Zavarzinella formosa TaxID=360055 RepID=UPI0012FC3A47|nr:DUF58 domain-containing protein [Zavarzinella formosa]
MPTPKQPVTAVALLPREGATSSLDGREGLLWFVAAGVMLFVGILKGINLVIVLGYALLGLAGLNWLLARRSITGLKARRLARFPIYAGIPTEWNIEITDLGTGTGNCQLEESTNEGECRWFFVRTPAPRVETIRCRLTLSTRGRHPLLPLKAITSYPFGLIHQSTELLPGDELIVLPRPARVDGERLRTWLLRTWAGRDEEQRRLRKVVDREAEIHGLRDYRQGDAPRRIHWRATARRNRLTVKEYEDAAPPRLLLILDPIVLGNSAIEDMKALELAISLTAGIVREWRRQAGARLTLIVAGSDPKAIDGPPGPTITERQLEMLALTQPSGDPELGTALQTLSRQALAAPTLVVSTRSDSLIPHEIYRMLGRTAAFISVDCPESWFQFETAGVELDTPADTENAEPENPS